MIDDKDLKDIEKADRVRKEKLEKESERGGKSWEQVITLEKQILDKH